ncbi:uncharacterized protein LACBIDRAFT_318427 [Laccaria bicolor S238N-H82]|uniref:Predicted protein n=1 Tax=Laccaria bicolor (strain S238N-H82 / ATCC MYA-4686) TaxID=486041 RepID=B0E2E8_LACBS|nr:uncharacterized protein LACBIDRAFT_318427 [Laccaria bicolor S238N-H82]EDQ98981.1 predicted protein [Laccaria bicolor S238N-H82]|eukprot:XP_001890383.1 predicted protein [Laccaria bicolor S238N-H82]
MANLLVWPSKYFFYAIGNTSAVSLTADLTLEEPARILLLGCGDPRNVLHTIFTEPRNSGRALDFTCCDFDPAVLARNVLLLTMIADRRPYATIWNIFFHFRLDKDSHTALIDQCKKLIEHSETAQKWKVSPYASYIKMSTDYTLKELRRHWTLYVGMEELPNSRLAPIRDAFDRLSKKNSKEGTNTATRSLGPLQLRGFTIIPEHFRNYWKTGVTFVDGKRIAAATLLNPTFVYSLGGEGCSVHYGTDPLNLFHLAALFGNAKSAVSMAEVVKAANKEFAGWCSSYLDSLSSSSPPIIRFFVGEATAVCRALRAFGDVGILNSGVPVAQWKTQLIQLSGDEYYTSASGGAPVNFNVIHTSNLEDHIGLLNVLVTSLPLLSREPSSVLYTESLLFLGQDSATKEFTEHLHADLSVIGLLIGLSPVDFLCGFSSRSNTHELIMHRQSKQETNISQFQQVTTWKAPTSGDTIASQAAYISSPVFDEHQLGTLLYDIYQSLFEQETSKTFWAANQKNVYKAVGVSNLAHYSRESFVLLLQLIRRRLQPSEDSWTRVMDRFMSLQLAAWSIESMDTLHYQDFCGQLHRHGVYKAPFFHMPTPKIGRFSLWDTVPGLVRIVLVVPREKLSVLKNSKPEEIGSPPLQCDIFGMRNHNIFTAVHVAFGRAIPMGTKSRPHVIFEEDTSGWAGSSSLVASFVAPSWLLCAEPPEQLSIGFGVRNTPLACKTLIKTLGLTLRVFSAKLMDKTLVHVLPEHPLPSRYPSESLGRTEPGVLSQIGESGTASVELDEQCELITSLTARVSITNEDSARLFSEAGGKVVPQITQLSPCIIRVALGDRTQDIVYPFPVAGSAHRLRLARKSRYIEVVVPTSRSLMPDGMKLNPFPVINSKGLLHTWSIHRVNLSALPILDVKARNVKEWLDPHVASIMSARELSLRKKHQTDTLMFVKNTLQSIFVGASGIQGGTVHRLFALRDKKTNNCDTCIFIDEIRYDLAAHTLICDGYVLPLTVRIIKENEKPFASLVHQGKMIHINVLEGEMQAWKQLLPAFVERCRSSWTHGANCEYIAQGRIPLTEDMEADPLCSCGRGKDVEGMHKVGLWKTFAPYVTRVALSPLFAVSYLETVGRDPDARKCRVCRGKGKPKIKECSVCQKVRYCSPECQKKDWKAHKPKCKP